MSPVSDVMMNQDDKNGSRHNEVVGNGKVSVPPPNHIAIILRYAAPSNERHRHGSMLTLRGPNLGAGSDRVPDAAMSGWRPFSNSILGLGPWICHQPYGTLWAAGPSAHRCRLMRSRNDQTARDAISRCNRQLACYFMFSEDWACCAKVYLNTMHFASPAESTGNLPLARPCRWAANEYFGSPSPRRVDEKQLDRSVCHQTQQNPEFSAQNLPHSTNGRHSVNAYSHPGGANLHAEGICLNPWE